MVAQGDIEIDVAALLDRDVENPGAGTVPIITHMARAYTRGRGFHGDEPNEEIAAVITTASARLASNAGQLPTDQTTGPFSQSIRGAFGGWTVAELAVLNRYRVRAM